MDAEKLSIDVEAETDDAERDLQAFALKTQALVAALSSLNASVKIDVDTSSLRPKVTAAAAAAGAGQKVEVPVEATGIPGVSSMLRGLSANLRNTALESRGLGASMRILIVPGVIMLINAAAGALGALTVAAAGLLSTLGPLTGLLATLPGLFGGIIAGAAGLLGAFKPIGGALKAYTQQENQAARASAGAARSTENAAKRRAAAAKEVERATRDLARAQRDAADNVEDAADNVQRAEENLRDAQERARDAQENLTEARERAAETVTKLGRSVEQAVLSERRARLRLSDAQAKNNKDSARAALINRALKGGRPEESIGDLYLATQDLGQAQRESARSALDLEQAELDLVEATDRRLELENRLVEVQQKGIEGSDEVVAANREIRDSQRAVRDSTKAVADSYENFQDAQIRGAERIEAANERIADSMDRLAEAAESAGAAGATAFKPFDDAMSKLSPLGRELVQVLLSFKDPLKAMREEIERFSFPQIIRGLTNLRNLIPTLTPVIAGATGQIATFFEKWTEMVTEKSFAKDLVDWGNSNNRALGNLGEGMLGLQQAFRHLLIAAMPVTEWLAESFAAWGKSLGVLMENKRANNGLRDFFIEVKEVAKLFGEILKNVFGIFVDIGKAAYPVGKDLLTMFKNLTDRTKKWTGSAEGQKEMLDTFREFVPLIVELGKLFLETAKFFGGLAKDNIGPTTEIVKKIRTEFIPALKEMFGLFKEHGPKVIDVFTRLVELINKLPLNVIGTFLVAIEKVLALAVLIVDKVPGMTTFLTILAAIAGISMAASAIFFFGKLMGLGKVAGFATGLFNVARGIEAVEKASAANRLGRWVGNRLGLGKIKAPGTTPTPTISGAGAAGTVAGNTAGTSFLTKFGSVLRGGLPKAIGAVGLAFAGIDIFQSVKASMDDNLSKIERDEERHKAIGGTIGLAVGGGIGFVIGGPVGAMIGASLGQMFGKAASGIDWKAVWENPLGRMGIAIATFGTSELVAIAANWGPKIWNKVSEFDWAKLGKQITDGIARGLEWGGGLVKKAWNGLIKYMPKKIRKDYEIKSPSRLMMRYGQMITAGLARGIGGGGKDVMKSFDGVTSGILRHQGAVAAKLGGDFTSTLTASMSPNSFSNVALASSIDRLAENIAHARKIEATFNDTVDSRKVARDLAWKL